MSLIELFDIPYIIGHTFLLAMIAVAPLFIFAIVSPRSKVLVTFTSLVLLLSWFILGGLVVSSNVSLWSSSGFPYTPFRFGPSLYSLKELTTFSAITLWLPGALVFSLAYVFARNRSKGPEWLSKATFSIITVFALWGTIWTWSVTSVLEYEHEDTVWAEGFSMEKWENVLQGMERSDVLTHLGEPLADPPTWSEEDGKAEWWVRNYSAGYFAVVWFQENRVTRKHFWYSD